mmetsp:Transcript_73720/g.193403  ORF Transcript_73720/g.193403 Transcript_73720/m.193403 type:complete len:230 (-) Transcript_73720:13-702(-)
MLLEFPLPLVKALRPQRRCLQPRVNLAACVSGHRAEACRHHVAHDLGLCEPVYRRGEGRAGRGGSHLYVGHDLFRHPRQFCGHLLAEDVAKEILRTVHVKVGRSGFEVARGWRSTPVVPGPEAVVPERVVRLGDQLEHLGRLPLLAAVLVRVVQQRLLPIGALELGGRRAAADAEDLIVIAGAPQLFSGPRAAHGPDAAAAGAPAPGMRESAAGQPPPPGGRSPPGRPA